MTCIVGLVDGKRVVMGGDSAGLSGTDIRGRRDEKVFRNGEFLIGFTSSFRMGQLLRYTFKPPVIPEGMDLSEYMTVLFMEEVRKVLREGGFTTKKDNAEKNGSFLVAVRGRLFEISEDNQVGEMLDDFAAVGCGADYARGCLYATPELPIEARVTRALEAAEHFSAGVRRPFIVRSLE